MESWSKKFSTISDKEVNSTQNGIVNDSTETLDEEKGLFAHSLGKKLFLAGEQWSQEENNAEDATNEISPTTNGHSYPPCKEQNSLTVANCNKQGFTHNNNLIEDKSNLTCAEDKSHCFYLKFPLKVNNNIYPEKSILKSDGMEEYFMQNASSNQGDSVSNISCSNNPLCNGSAVSSNFPTPPHLNIPDKQQNFECAVFDDQINALNGEEEDEDDGCIYTYKGDNYEANLSHLIETCFSCGLPTTERSGTHHGAVSIQRILNGSPHPNPNPQGNLYSPEMDFLEMDFDPGSNGDGSDCEDNSVLNIDDKFDPGNHSDILLRMDSNSEAKTNNIPNEIRSLMCRRCEMCMYNDQKVNNTSSLIPNPSIDNKIYKSSYSVLDDRLSFPSQVAKDLNVQDEEDKNSYSNFLCEQADTPAVDRVQAEEVDKESVENNLNLADEDFAPEFSDDAEDADDEDDSTSEHPPSDALLLPNRRNSSSSYFCPSSDNSNLKILTSQRECQQSNELNASTENLSNQEEVRKSSEACIAVPNLIHGLGECANKESKIPNHIFNEESNNNLGSISAPEVSPAKEFSPLEKFSRSISFHNQLSSPKYENVCFSHLKNNISGSNEHQCTSCNGPEYCSCKFGYNAKQNSQSKEVTNLEACVDRLSQREKSVFNIASGSVSSNVSHPEGPSRCHSPKFTNTSAQILQRLPPPSEDVGKEKSPDSLVMFNQDCLLQPIPPEDDDAHSLSCQQPGDIISPLPFKSIQPKSDDPSKDPNTASDDEHSSSPVKEIENNQIPKMMIWTERQATLRQVSQIGKSACGATAVINVLLALDHPRPIKTVTAAIHTRLRAEDAYLVDYLLSRSNAGTTHKDLIGGIEAISENSITGRFFHMFPKRSFQLSRWLIHWIVKGGVPVATLNLQVGVHLRQTIPDFWHHQMVFGVGPQGIYLTNPLECVSDSLLSEQLCSDSVLLVRRSDIVSRWDTKDHLIKLSLQPDPRWNDMSVLGQVVGVLKEHTSPEILNGWRHLTSHVTIPAAYQSGITIFMRKDNPCLSQLMNSPELPLLDE